MIRNSIESFSKENNRPIEDGENDSSIVCKTEIQRGLYMQHTNELFDL